MTFIYVTTDSFEAQELIEALKDGQKPKHTYHEIDPDHGKALADRVGFNPMTSIELHSKTSPMEIGGIVQKLLSHGFFVSVERNGSVESQYPDNLHFRNALVMAAFRKGPDRFGGVFSQASFNVLLYSNQPDRINEDFFL